MLTGRRRYRPYVIRFGRPTLHDGVGTTGADMSIMTLNYWPITTEYSDPVPLKTPNWRLILALSLNLVAWLVLLVIVF